MARRSGTHRDLAGQLAAAVGAERGDRIVLPVGRLLAAVEDVVGREVDEGQVARGAGPRNRGRTLLVGGEGRRGLALCLVDGGVGGRVDDQVGLRLCHCRGERGRVAEVGFAPSDRADADVPARGGGQQGAADLAAAAEHQ
jgi:hypothetical protein